MSIIDRRRGGVLLLGILAVTGPGSLACASLPAPLAPVRPPDEAAIALERMILVEKQGQLALADDAVLRLGDGEAVSGREAILRFLGPVAPYLRPAASAGTKVYRCGEERGIERGAYRAPHDLGALPAAGRWHAVWEATEGGDWQIREVMLLGPRASYPGLPEGCVEGLGEAWAAGRLTLSVHGYPLAYYSARPHADVRGLGPNMVGTETAGLGGILGGRWRFGNSLAAGGYWGREPPVRTRYESAATGTTYLVSNGTFAGLVAGYEGRNVSLDAGPVWFRSSWSWLNYQERADTVARYERLGAIVTLRVALPMAWDMATDLVIQHRFFGREEVPHRSRQVFADRSGLFIGLGLALRKTR